jgi:phosphatidylglycerol:prolipoprotein diacylglycerol transferase
MIPWFSFTHISIGPLTLQVWGLFVSAGIVLATWLAAKRACRSGLNPKQIWDMAFWVIIWGVIGARLMHVLLYEPAYYLANPWEIIDLRQPGFAITGGLLGGAAAFYTMVRRRGLDFLAYADAVAWALPWGYACGRIGCFLIHDHPGTLTSFIGGVKYPDGVRHDLGLSLALLGIAIGTAFALLGRKKQKPGYFLALFLVLYGTARFLLDFLRVADARWVGLTPTQWLMAAFIGVGAWMLLSPKRTVR